MNFHNIRLPKFIEVFTIGYPMFSTSCATTISGREVRNIDREEAQQRYIIKNCKLSQQEFDQFNSFFRARRGQGFGFLLCDPADNIINKQSLAKGNGNEREFPIFKTYYDAVSSYRRRITKPVVNSVQVYIENHLTVVDVDYQQGIIRLPEPLEIEKDLVVELAFDVPIRFAQDSFAYSYNIDGSIELLEIELLEII